MIYLDANLDKEIKYLSRKNKADVIKWRRHIHMNPELSFQEFATTDFIEQTLLDIGIKDIEKITETGLVAHINRNTAGPLIALRADIDALPIQEQSTVPYRSKISNVMHACGHDVHTSILLGVAQVLWQIKDQLSGSIRLIFQAGEEKLPGGASLMIKAGVLDNPKPKLIIGQHVHPPLEVGMVGYCAGNYMASADEIYLKIIGKGGHAALPASNIDPIIISSQILVGLQQIVSRRNNPAMPTVLSFGKINSDGGATNIIPNSVSLEGTFRTFDESWRLEAHDLIHDYIVMVAEAYGAKAELEIKKGYPVLHNNDQITELCKSVSKQILGNDQVADLPIRLSSEDFAFYSHEVPACFFRLGTGNKGKGIKSGVHTPTFDIDEESLEIGVYNLASLAVGALKF